MDVAVASVAAPEEERPNRRRLITIVGVAIGLGVIGALVAQVLLGLIALMTNLAFAGHFALGEVTMPVGPFEPRVLVIPMLGALVIGLMARYGSSAIRGHGIPEVMEKVLYGRSRIPPRVLFLKPLSAAIAIGTGGPFGAEGPIIATGGAMGSLVGQTLHITADERKTLLAAGAAAGMAATFGTPVAAVLLAVELLLFEYRARSVIPVALAAASATAMRILLVGGAPVFAMPAVGTPSWPALVAYVIIGAAVGLAAVGITRIVYAIEDGFERLPVHWMWWPAIGAVAVGVCGFIDPRVLGVGYVQIEALLSGTVLGWSLAALVLLKFVAWSIYLGSGTSGGTLAPLFIIGGGLGAGLGAAGDAVAPQLEISVPVAALLGMASAFAGASHALLTSIVFAFEATRQPLGLLPLLAGCSAAYLVSVLLMRTSIMTERLARRGAPVRPEYTMDYLAQVLVRDAMAKQVVTLAADRRVGEVRDWLGQPIAAADHNGFPIVDRQGSLIGVLTRRDLLDPVIDPRLPVADLVQRSLVVAYPDNTLREAANHMVRESVGRLPVLDRASGALIGIITRSDLLAAHESRLHALDERERGLGSA